MSVFKTLNFKTIKNRAANLNVLNVGADTRIGYTSYDGYKEV